VRRLRVFKMLFDSIGISVLQQSVAEGLVKLVPAHSPKFGNLQKLIPTVRYMLHYKCR